MKRIVIGLALTGMIACSGNSDKQRDFVAHYCTNWTTELELEASALEHDQPEKRTGLGPLSWLVERFSFCVRTGGGEESLRSEFKDAVTNYSRAEIADDRATALESVREMIELIRRMQALHE